MQFAIAQPAFLKPENLVGIVRQMVLVGIMAVGMTFVIMTGGVDLSVGPVLALSGLAAFFCLDAGLPVAVAIVAGASIGLGSDFPTSGSSICTTQIPSKPTFIARSGVGFPFSKKSSAASSQFLHACRA